MNYTRYEKVKYSFKLKESDLATSWATDFEIVETKEGLAKFMDVCAKRIPFDTSVAT